jgi:predicted dehydrogenase
MLSVGIVGARRRRQGIGEHVARWFVARGAEVRAVVGTSPETVALAREALASVAGIHCRGYTSVEALLDGERPDALAICSPVETHAAALEIAARRRVHVLCEKPLLAPAPGAELGAEARAIAARFAAAGRLLRTVTQWPYTLGAFRRLYPGQDLGAVRRFAMRLSPATRGAARMIADSLPHPLSVLRALAGPGAVRLRAIEVPSEDEARVRFAWEHARGAIEAEVVLVRVPEQPRPAWIEIDGRRAEREVRLADYAMALVGERKRVPLEDPLGLLVGDFVEALRLGTPTDVEGIACEAAALAAILQGIETEAARST